MTLTIEAGCRAREQYLTALRRHPFAADDTPEGEA